MKLSRPLLVLFLAGTVLAAPAAAHADTLVRSDAAGDVVVTETSMVSVEPPVFEPAPAQTQADIVATSLTHNANAVRVKIRARELVRQGSIFASVMIRSDKRNRWVDLNARPGAYFGRTEIYNPRSESDDVRCAGMSHKIDYVANTMLVVIPRSCLGNPNWVRIGVGVVSTKNGGRTIYVDDARRTGYSAEMGDPLYSRRIYR